MRLHENRELFAGAVATTSKIMDIPEAYAEKDYWVTFVLKEIFSSDVGKDTVFKGGTALLKCFKLIERFSEDVDLVIIKHEGESANQLTTKIRKISKIVSKMLPEVIHEKLTNKKGNIRKTVHSYEKIFQGNFSQVHDFIVVEATWLGYFEPYTTSKVSSFIYQMMKDAGQDGLVKEYAMEPFEVLVLDPKRTLCEKIMSLVRFSYSEDAIPDLSMKIRHTYDLNQMLKNKELLEFFESEEFDEMLLKVGNDDIVSFKNNNQWLNNHPEKAFIFSDTETVWKELKRVYNSDFRNLVYGELPDGKEIYETLVKIKMRLKSVEWTVRI